MTGRVSVERIKAVVAADYGIPLKAIDTYRRFKAYALPRQVAMYLACSLTEQSFPAIARRFANRDHTTVYHAFRKVAELRSVDRDLDQRLLRLECDLRQPGTIAQEVQLSFLIGPLFDQPRAGPQPTLTRIAA
jgi:chromosomal replication initiator protein